MIKSAAVFAALLLVACGSSDSSSVGDGPSDTTSRPEATQAPDSSTSSESNLEMLPVIADQEKTTAGTDALSSSTTSTELAPTTAAPRTVVATGTWADIPETSYSTAKLPSGYTWLGEDLAFDGDLVGTTLYDIGVSPVSASGLVTSYADGTFRGTLVGVGDGTLAWSESEKDVSLPAAPGSAPLVGVSGVFLGASGSFSWTYTDDSHGTYEVRLVWD